MPTLSFRNRKQCVRGKTPIRRSAARRRVRAILSHIRTGSKGTETKASREEVDDKYRISEGDVVEVICVGTTEEGIPVEMFERNRTRFAARSSGEISGGSRILMPALSSVCIGMRRRDTKTFVVKPGDPSHPQSFRDSSLVVDVRKDTNDNVAVGMLARYRHEGNLRLGKVIEVRDNVVTIDMNDPLAGHELHMQVTIERVEQRDKRSQRSDVPSFLTPVHVGERVFSLQDLSPFNGKDRESIFISVRGFVYDVTSGKEFYGPGGGYAFMSGNDATVVLARMQLKRELLNKDWAELDAASREVLADYIRLFNSKYPCVGRLRDGEIRSLRK